MRVKILLYAEYRLPLGKGEKRLKKKRYQKRAISGVIERKLI